MTSVPFHPIRVFDETKHEAIAQPGFLEQWANLHYDQKVEWAK